MKRALNRGRLGCSTNSAYFLSFSKKVFSMAVMAKIKAEQLIGKNTCSEWLTQQVKWIMSERLLKNYKFSRAAAK